MERGVTIGLVQGNGQPHGYSSLADCHCRLDCDGDRIATGFPKMGRHRGRWRFGLSARHRAQPGGPASVGCGFPWFARPQPNDDRDRCARRQVRTGRHGHLARLGATHARLRAAAAQWAKLPLAKTDWKPESLTVGERNLIESVTDNLVQCIEIDDKLADLEAVNEDYHLASLRDAYEMLSKVRQRQGDQEEYKRLTDLSHLLSENNANTLPLRLPKWAVALTDVWTWRNSIVGHKLGSANPHARLISLHLDNEFTATANIALAEGVEGLIRSIKQEYASITSPNLQIEISGSAAVGADMLRAAQSGVKQTEGVTILLVIVILALVYRGPFLVAIPLTSIALSLLIATNLLALMARDPNFPERGGLGIFTTTRIFIIVLLFGAGTDFCLFFLARCREVLERTPTRSRKHYHRAIGRAWRACITPSSPVQ